MAEKQACSWCSVFGSESKGRGDDLRGGERHHFDPGTSLFNEGMPADNLFCLHEGFVKVYKTWTDGRHCIVKLARRCDLIGMGAAVQGAAYSVSATALTDVSACVIPRTVLRARLREDPDAALSMIEVMTRSLDAAAEQSLTLALNHVPDRLARLLLRLVATDGDGAVGTLNLPLRRADLAEMIGTTVETLSRVLHRFERDGLVGLDGSLIRIDDVRLLRRQAGVD